MFAGLLSDVASHALAIGAGTVVGWYVRRWLETHAGGLTPSPAPGDRDTGGDGGDTGGDH